MSFLLRWSVCLNPEGVRRVVKMGIQGDKLGLAQGTDQMSEFARNNFEWALLKGCRRQLWPQLIDIGTETLDFTVENAEEGNLYRIDAFCMLGVANDIKGNYHCAMQYLERALRELTTSPNPSELQEMYIQLNIANFAIEEYDRSKNVTDLDIALISGRKCCAICPKSTQWQGRSLLRLGSALKRKSMSAPEGSIGSEALKVLEELVHADYASSFDRLHAYMGKIVRTTRCTTRCVVWP
jgi:hypothetical protein